MTASHTPPAFDAAETARRLPYAALVEAIQIAAVDYAHGRMRITSYHPGQSIEKIQTKTGFQLEVTPDLHETEPPTVEEVRLLREEIDPLGVRKLETLSGAQRKELIREILKREASHGEAAH